MSLTGLSTLDNSVHITNTWLKQLAEELGWEHDRPRVYGALRAVLHALRDRLTVEEAVDLAAQLPVIVRGVYYEGWRPSGKPLKERHIEQFLAHVASEIPQIGVADVQAVTQAVFRVLQDHVSGGELADVRNTLPQEVRNLWDRA